MNQKPLLLIPLLFLVSCTKKEEKEVEAPAPVQVTAVTQDTIRRIVAGDGMLFPRDQAGVTAKIAAPVQRFLVQRGDHVRQGQLLAVLESRDLSAGAAESQAVLAQTEANLRSTTSAQIPESIVKAQTRRRYRQTDRGSRQEAARQSREALTAGRARTQTGGRCAGGLRAGPRRAALRAGTSARAAGRRQARADQDRGLAGGGRAQPPAIFPGPGKLLADRQPDLRRGRRSPALCRRDGHARHAPGHGDGYLQDHRARQRSAESVGIGESRASPPPSPRSIPTRPWRAR